MALPNSCSIRKICTLALVIVFLPVLFLFNRLRTYSVASSRASFSTGIVEPTASEDHDIQQGKTFIRKPAPRGSSIREDQASFERIKHSITFEQREFKLRASRAIAFGNRIQLAKALPKFYILSGKDHPAFNSDLCQALPFSWRDATIEDRIAASGCRLLA